LGAAALIQEFLPIPKQVDQGVLSLLPTGALFAFYKTASVCRKRHKEFATLGAKVFWVFS
jgi:hypothetical protein